MITHFLDYPYKSDLRPSFYKRLKRFLKERKERLVYLASTFLATVFFLHLAAYHMQAGIPMFAVDTTILAFSLIIISVNLD